MFGPSLMVMAETAVSTSWNGVTSDSLMALVDTFKEIIPIALPVAMTVLFLRKGISFLFGLIRGA